MTKKMTVKLAGFFTTVLVLLMVMGSVCAMANEPTKQGKGSAVKTGESYQGEVRHFAMLRIGQNQAIVNGESKTLDAPPMLYKSCTMVPLRFIAETFGADVQWDPAEQKIMITASGGEGAAPAEKTQFDVILKIGQNQAFVNGESKTLDVPPMLYEGRTMVPLRFIAEALWTDVQWDPAEQRVTIVLAIVPSVPASKSSLYVMNTDPANNATNVPSDKTITVTFNKVIQQGSNYNNISVTNTATGNSVAIQTDFVNMYLCIYKLPGPGWNGEYVVTIPAGAVTTTYSSGSIIGNSAYTFQFSTEDTAPPAVVSTYPANNATGVPVNSIITITFNENIQQGSAYDNISFTDVAGNNVTKLKEIVGKFLTITPGSPGSLPESAGIPDLTTKSLKWYHYNLAPNTLYTVTIPAGAVKDSANNALGQTYSFRFTTGVANAANQTPVLGAEIAVKQILPVKTTVLKPIKCKTNNKGEFSFSIPEEQFNKLPDEFSLQMTIIPPIGWTGISSSNEVTVKVEKSDGPKFEFVLLWQEEGDTKANKGCFAVNAKTQS